MTETSDPTDRELRIPDLKIGDEIGSYHVVEASPTRLALGTNYGMLLFMLALGIAMLVFDWWIFQQRVLSHVLLAWNDTTALAFKGAMIVLPVFGIPFVLYSLGRSIVIDAEAGVLAQRRLFVFGKTAPMSAVARVEIAFTPPVSESSDSYARLRVLDVKGEALLEFLEVAAERDDLFSKDTSDFAKMLPVARKVAALTGGPVTISGDMSALSPVNRRMLEHATGF